MPPASPVHVGESDTMSETSVIRPWQPVQASPNAARPQQAMPSETDERLMMARLFGRGALQTAKTPAAPPRGPDDEFAPHLGRHVDVVA
jgi:hypothetical protein